MSNIPPVQNPFASPLTTSSLSPPLHPDSENESIRRKHLNHEASVKSVGFLYWVGGALFAVSGIANCVIGIAAISSERAELPIEMTMLITGAVLLLVAMGLLYGATLVRKLENTGRIIITVFSAIGLLAFPFGTLINVYILYLLWSVKGSFIFTPEYRSIVKATPHIKYKTHIAVWILLGLVLALVAVGFASMAFTDGGR